jgi:large subunit ribosomal protein L19
VQDAILDKLEKAQEKKRPAFAVGDKVNVSVRLKEGDKERIQAFRGVVISKHPKSGRGTNAMFTVRKISEGIGVERIFPVHSPFIEKIEVESSSIVRRSRLYYLRSLKGKKARLKEAERFGDVVVRKEAKAAPVEAEASPTEGAAASETATSSETKTTKS